jgi:DNA-binding GntR family transcriptional regulator
MTMVNESLEDHHQRTGVLSFNLDRTRCATAISQHRAIVTALAGYDLEAARTEIEQHLVRGERDFERLLRD